MRNMDLQNQLHLVNVEKCGIDRPAALEIIDCIDPACLLWPVFFYFLLSLGWWWIGRFLVHQYSGWPCRTQVSKHSRRGGIYIPCVSWKRFPQLQRRIHGEALGGESKSPPPPFLYLFHNFSRPPSPPPRLNTPILRER